MKLFNSKAEQIYYLVYTITMLLLYLGYVALDNARLSKGAMRGNGTPITDVEWEAMSQMVAWTVNLEFIFLGLFVVMLSIMYFRSFKNKSVIKPFLVTHAVLFTVLLVLSFALLPVTSLPIGNLLQPLLSLAIITLFLISLFFVIFILRTMKKKTEQSF
ncbi:ftsK/SpoIIIE family protein [Oceanobacillus picturae]|uniref:FtsK/SpoIIIE family protein n=1 Tax=Oceanobacillus picturae TaxID=171693 RepID=A0A0U9H2U5_9BACI|nr:hypothetical protein [Oceanobacillus picturae]GAQ16767.1 ftsK/SpoIIIE family protein [Oceanobacillus picturae]